VKGEEGVGRGAGVVERPAEEQDMEQFNVEESGYGEYQQLYESYAPPQYYAFDQTVTQPYGYEAPYGYGPYEGMYEEATPARRPSGFIAQYTGPEKRRADRPSYGWSPAPRGRPSGSRGIDGRYAFVGAA